MNNPASSQSSPQSSPQPSTDCAFGIVPLAPASETEPAPQFLLIQHQAGHWGFPKGHAEADETPIVAACREFEEETGIRAYRLLDETAFSESYRFTKKQTSIEKTVTYYVALVATRQVMIQTKELQDFVWLPYAAALERITFPQSQALLTQVNDHLRAREMA